MKSGSYVLVNGKEISVRDARKRVKLIYDLARNIAGEFHDMERSEKFRANWPSQDEFVKHEWRTFVQAARLMITTNILGKQEVSTKDKDEYFEALIIERDISQGQETDARLQLMPNTQQFVGDRHENIKIKEKFGNSTNLRAWLKRSVAIH